MIRIFENKGVLSGEEVRTIRTLLEKEQKGLSQKEEELEAREKALEEREKEFARKKKTAEAEVRKEEPTEQAVIPSSALPVASAEEEKKAPFKVTYDQGFSFRSPDPDLFTLRIGGLLQTDYRYYDYENDDPDKNKFDIRRARLSLAGRMLRYFGYKFEYEFQGAESRNLLDAYADLLIAPELALRVGQFKEPFSLEQMTKDRNGFFTERSMGYYLTPQRDLGVMAHGSLWNDRIGYGLGVFNGDGLDNSVGGNEDAPAVAGRVIFEPFKGARFSWLENLLLGGSFEHARIDSNNVEATVKTSGLTTFFDVASQAKFGVIQDADTRTRYGVEGAWSYGPVAFQGEYVFLGFDGVDARSKVFDINLENYYISALWMLTGEQPVYTNGVFQTIDVPKGVGSGGWGALGLALRYNVFEADDSVYDNLINIGQSVRKAEAYSIALNWYLNDFSRLILDYTHTDFDEPLLIGHDAVTGDSIYSEDEQVVTGRFQLNF